MDKFSIKIEVSQTKKKVFLQFLRCYLNGSLQLFYDGNISEVLFYHLVLSASKVTLIWWYEYIVDKW